MAIFEVYIPEKAAPPEQAVMARFLKDRVSVLALIVPAVWLLWHRLWFAFAVYLVFVLALAGLGLTAYAPATLAFSLIPGILVFLEGGNLIADKWESDGFQLVDIIEGDNPENAELRWVSREKLWNRQGTGSDPVANAIHPAMPRSLENDERPDFGLFAEDQA